MSPSPVYVDNRPRSVVRGMVSGTKEEDLATRILVTTRCRSITCNTCKCRRLKTISRREGSKSTTTTYSNGLDGQCSLPLSWNSGVLHCVSGIFGKNHKIETPEY